MKSFIERLKKYNSTLNINQRYEYKFDLNPNLFNEEEKTLLIKESNIFNRNVILKDIIKTKLKGSFDNNDLNFWIINNWGGIKTFKLNDSNLKKISKFKKQISETNHPKKLTRDTFGTISSLSKIASFVDPENFFIYDSRVIYSINWLLLTSENQMNYKFFPMPTSRNVKLIDFDISTIINLKFFETYSTETLYYDYKTAYFEYCKLIKLHHKEVFENINTKPFYLEMLLFSIIEEIYSEFTSKIKIDIK